MSDNLLQIILALVGLVGVLLGALIGAAIGYKGTLNAAKKQIDFLYSQERENRTYQEKQQEGVMKVALLVEIEENLRLARSLATGEAAENIKIQPAWDIFKGKYVLTSEAWDIFKGNITKLSSALQTKLLLVYIEVRKYNSLIEYERFKLEFREGYLDQLIKKQAEKVVSTCESAIEELSKD